MIDLLKNPLLQEETDKVTHLNQECSITIFLQLFDNPTKNVKKLICCKMLS